MPLDRNQPARSKWLQDGGLGEDNLYYLCCSICSTKVAACKFQSRSQNIKFHEASQLHQRAALKWQEIQDGRGVCCKVTRMQLHSSQLSAVSCQTNSKPQDAHSVCKCTQAHAHMRLGRPITDVLADKEFLQFVEPAPSVGVTELNRYSQTDFSVGQTDRLVGLRTYQCWYMLYFYFRAMPETFDLPRARTLRPPSGLGIKGCKTSNKGF